MTYKILSLILILSSLIITLPGYGNQGIKLNSVKTVSKRFKESQLHLKEACQNKGIVKALRDLNKADDSIKKAKEALVNWTPSSSSESRMKSRMLYKIDQDILFLNQLRVDLGMSESDNFESYQILRSSLLQIEDQRPHVVKMDYQIIQTIGARAIN